MRKTLVLQYVDNLQKHTLQNASTRTQIHEYANFLCTYAMTNHAKCLQKLMICISNRTLHVKLPCVWWRDSKIMQFHC